MKTALLIFYLMVSSTVFSQVGIGTINPQSTLHVEGTLQVTSTDYVTEANKLAGTGTEGRITDVIVGENLTLENNVLSAAKGDTNAYYKVADIPIDPPYPNYSYDNFDIQVDGIYSDVVIFRLNGATNNFTISGITGGTEGRHIILYNSSNVNMKMGHLITSLIYNQIDTLGTSTATSGIGTIELVYDSIIEKWVVVNIRD